MRAALLVAALLLAGCSEAAPVDDEPEAFQEAKATSTTGVIRGLVVDQAIVPVEGAQIKLSPSDLTTTSDAEGAFVFKDLEPGTYFLKVSGDDLEAVQASATVEAGVDNPPIVRIQVTITPPPTPFVEPFTTNAFLDMSFNVMGNRFVLGGATGQGTFASSYEFSPNGTWVHSELVWTAAHELAKAARIDATLSDPEGNKGSSAQGTSPLIHAFDNGTVTPASNGISYVLWAGNGDYPVGATVQQQMTMYSFVFHYFIPDEGWTFSADGEHPLP